MTVAMAEMDLTARGPAPAGRDFGDGTGGRWLLVLGMASVGVHLALFSALSGVNGRSNHGLTRAPAQVTMEVAPPRAPVPPPEAEPPRPRVAAPKVKVAASRQPARVAAPPRPAAPKAETLADFSGVTLTNDGDGPGWASAVGNGAAMRGPVGAPHAKVTARVVDAPPPEAVVVPLASLSRPPVPPDLAGMLERYYPDAARKSGQGGQAVLKARVQPTGRVRDLVVVSETAPGFGDACKAALRDSQWTPPLDREGHPAATVINYTCRFEVR